MTKLMNIKGNWNMDYSRNFNDKDMFEGQILLQDDGWFEGIVVNPNIPHKEDAFIFGFYYPEKIIKLFKFTPLSISYPFIFYGKKDSNGYEGKFETINLLFQKKLCGNSRIMTQYLKTVERENDEESQKLMFKIERYKYSVMDEICEEYYEDSICMRKIMTESVLKNSEESKFHQEEFEPTNNIVKPSTEEKVKKLVKKV